MTTLSPLLRQAMPIIATRGEGTYLFDDGGRRYLDFTAGIAVTSTGHCHPAVVEAIRRQAGELIHGQYTTVRHRPLLELVDRLATVMPAGLDSIFFASAGTESIEAAIRLARQATGRQVVVVFQGGFHGRTTGSASLTTSRAAIRSGFQPLAAGVVVAPFPYAFRYGWDEEETTAFCLRELDHLLATQTDPREVAAILVEPVQGEGGYVPAPPAFLQGLRERADRYGMVFIVDEIQTGFGRTGRFWGHEHMAVRPDILVMGKGLASGMPLSAFAASSALMSKGWPGSQGGTYGANPIACAAAIATLDVFRSERLVERAATLGPLLLRELRAVATSYPQIGDVRGLGLMVGTELVDASSAPNGKLAAQVQQRCGDLGLLLLTCGAYGNVVRWMPPLVVSETQIREATSIFGRALGEVAGEPSRAAARKRPIAAVPTANR